MPDEVNSIKWDPSGTYLASCSDDHTAKIWATDQDTALWDLVGHKREIYTIRWSPQTGGRFLLATASFDNDVRVWDAQNGTCLFVLSGHSEAVYSVSFSPTEMYLASGSFDQSVLLWSLKDGSLVKSHNGVGGVFEVSWNSRGDRLAACFAGSKAALSMQMNNHDVPPAVVANASAIASISHKASSAIAGSTASQHASTPRQSVTTAVSAAGQRTDRHTDKESGTSTSSNSNSNGDGDGETEVLDDEPRNILMGIIAQLRKGMDLHRVTLPTFVLEPRSMCERISDFLTHQDIILRTAHKPDAMDRFLDVVSYFLSGWHIRPKGVKKPFNPVLGEIFRCQWTFEDGSESIYVCEQVSHHPPASAYFYASPENDVWISGELKPRARFLGNSAATVMEGSSRVMFKSRPGEVYEIQMPTMYARGILFGSMYIELGDTATVRCSKTDLVCTIDFKTKSMFGSGERNAIVGKIKQESTGTVLHKIHGTWSDKMWLQTGKNDKSKTLFDAGSAKYVPKHVHAIAQQDEFESRRHVYALVARAIISRDMDAATVEKLKIEDNQRVIVKNRELQGKAWQSRFFEPDGDGWKLRLNNLSIPNDPMEAKAFLKSIIFSPPSLDMHRNFWIASSDSVVPATTKQ
eukprot:jgi/Hompol1/1401/HPOL_005586-RA